MVTSQALTGHSDGAIAARVVMAGVRRIAKCGCRGRNEIYRVMLIYLADIRLVRAIAEGGCCHRRIMDRNIDRVAIHRLDKALSRIYGRGN
jgi:hypothetical protein